jgi:hypothetical protein
MHPATSAATNPSTMPMVADTAAISSASVTTAPVKPSSSRSTLGGTALRIGRSAAIARSLPSALPSSADCSTRPTWKTT